jgi:hypothetical protein
VSESSYEEELQQEAVARELADFLPSELVSGFEEQIATLQLAYAKAVQEPGDADG